MKMDKIQINLLLAHLYNNVWAMEERALFSLHNFLLNKSPNLTITADEAKELEISAKARPSASSNGSVAVIPVNGAIQQKMNIFMRIFGGTSTEMLAEQIEGLANDSTVKAIVLDVNSPGGTVSGLIELADVIMKAREKKHIVAVCNPLCASAAYWIASQCDEVVCTPSGSVGSVGVYMVHEDWSAAYEKYGIKPTIIKYGENKTQGNPYEPLSDEAKEQFQAEVNKLGKLFEKTVARGREITAKDVHSNFGQGRVFDADEAKKIGMVDRVSTLKDVISKLVGAKPAMGKSFAQAKISILKNS
jgi:capsid assembly protease